jgi:ribosomal protein L7/L12
MDIRVFVDSLTESEMNQITIEIAERRRALVAVRARPLTDEEKDLVKQGRWIFAIKSHRERYGSSLLEAKIAVDDYRDSIKELK